MLNKLLVHLKNILFFKFTIYLLTLIGLILLIPIFEENLQNAKNNKDKSQVFLQNIANKLSSIETFKSEMNNINNRYNDLMNLREDLYCKERLNLINQIVILAKAYQLTKPIHYSISRSYEYEDSLTKAHHLAIQYYDLDLSFDVVDDNQLFSITRDLYNLLPEGSIVLEQVVNKSEEINPELALMLQKGIQPNLINVKIKIMLRYVIYNK